MHGFLLSTIEWAERKVNDEPKLYRDAYCYFIATAKKFTIRHTSEKRQIIFPKFRGKIPELFFVLASQIYKNKEIKVRRLLCVKQYTYKLPFEFCMKVSFSRNISLQTQQG